MDMSAVFLSASVPDPARDPTYFSTGDVVRIRAAVTALLEVVLPRGVLVWGGHPAIAPFVRRVAGRLDRADRVETWVSAWFRDQIPADTRKLPDLRWTPEGEDLEQSLITLRERMLASHPFAAAVFIGGMEGVEREFDMFREAWPDVPVLPVASTGAAALRLWRAHPQDDADTQERLAHDAVYDLLLEDLLVPLLGDGIGRDRPKPSEGRTGPPARVLPPSTSDSANAVDPLEPSDDARGDRGAIARGADARVFISHAAADAFVAQALHRALVDAGVETWSESLSLTAGEDWDLAVSAAIHAASIIAVLFSPTWSAPAGTDAEHLPEPVARAIDLAQNRDPPMKIVPIALDGADVQPAPAGLRRVAPIRVESARIGDVVDRILHALSRADRPIIDP